MKVSQLKIYSVGVVAANKLRSSKVIEATPIEAVNQTNGELTDNMTTTSVKGTDADGSGFETSVNSATTVPATWFALGSPNRTTAPDVRRGERVVLWEFGDTNQYWWTTFEGIDKYRKLETAIFAFSATRNEDEKPSPENTYFLEVSTHDKKIHFHTSKADGEPFAYDAMLDTENGIFQFRDDIENILFLNSREHQWGIKNADGSFLEIIKKVININGVDEINMTAGKHIKMKAGNFIDMDAGNTISMTGPDSITSTTDLFKVEAPQSNFSGNLTTKGRITAGGGLSITGGAGAKISGYVESDSGSSWGGVVAAQRFDGPH